MTIEKNPLTATDAITPISPELVQQLSQGGFKTLAQVAQFNPESYVKQPIFSTDSLQFGVYCLELGQINALHKHPQSDEICYIVQGTGEGVSMPLKQLSMKSEIQGQNRCWSSSFSLLPCLSNLRAN